MKPTIRMKTTKWLKPLLPDGGWEDVKYLILWTFPWQATLEANEIRSQPDKPIYYCDLRNHFRKVIQNVFWEKKSEIFNQLNQAIGSKDWESVYKLQKEICTKYEIALRDRVEECYLFGSSKDTERLPKKYNTYSECIEKIKSGDITVLLNWKSKGEKLEVSKQVKRGFEYREISEEYIKISEAYRKISEAYIKISEEYRKRFESNLKKWMNYCTIETSLLNFKHSTSGGNRKSLDDILGDRNLSK